jgi:enoyl-CoA hydratase/carnithine racemase
MATQEIIEHNKQGRVSVLSMNYRPHNLLGPTLLEELIKALKKVKDAGSTAVVLKSSLRHFSAGAEIEMFEDVVNKGKGLPCDFTQFLHDFETFPLPIVAAIHGVCVGGGFELALACDYIVAAASSKIGSVEATLGLHPLMGAIQRTTQRAGALRAKEMALLARRYDPVTLERWGLLNLVVPDADLDQTALTVAEELAHGPTVAHLATKKLVHVAVNQGVDAADKAMTEIQKSIWASQDLKTGLTSYRQTGVGAAKFEGR